MSAQDRSSDYVAKMLESSKQAVGYVEGLTKEDFFGDAKTQDAVIMKLLVIGELAAQLIERCPKFVGANPCIFWHQMKGMRNRIAHGYFEIDVEIVWETCRSLQPLIQDLESIRF